MCALMQDRRHAELRCVYKAGSLIKAALHFKWRLKSSALQAREAESLLTAVQVQGVLKRLLRETGTPDLGQSVIQIYPVLCRTKSSGISPPPSHKANARISPEYLLFLEFQQTLTLEIERNSH